MSAIHAILTASSKPKKVLRQIWRVWIMLWPLCTWGFQATPQPTAWQGIFEQMFDNPQFWVNADILLNDKKILSSNSIKKTDWLQSNLSVQINEKHITWLLTDSVGNTLKLDFGYDFKLIFGKDKKDLQDELFVRLKEIRFNSTSEKRQSDEKRVFVEASGDRFGGALTRLAYYDQQDSSIVCSPSYPYESLVNAMTNNGQCDGLYDFRVVVHRYGYRRDTVATSLAAMLDATGAVHWPKWSSWNTEEGLTVLWQHPHIGLDHLLIVKLETKGTNTVWLADFYSFIPNYNVKNLFLQFKDATANKMQLIIE